MAIYHITPNNDLHEHSTDSDVLCSCNPAVKIIEDTGDLMYVHNSWDGREYIERLVESAKDNTN